MLKSLGGMLLGPLVIVVGIAITVAAFHQASKLRLLNNHGKVATAVVTMVHWKTKNFTDSDFTVDVQFVTADKQNITVGGVGIPTSLGREIRDKKGGTLRLRYVPEDPQQIDLADYPSNPGEDKVFGVIVALVGVGIMWWRRHNATAEA